MDLGRRDGGSVFHLLRERAAGAARVLCAGMSPPLRPAARPTAWGERGRRFGYQVRLAALGLRRNRGLSLAVFGCLALVASIWCAISLVYVRHYSPRAPLAASLYQVELIHPRSDTSAMGVTNAAMSALHLRTRVSYPEYQVLAASGIPTRATGTFRSQVLVTDAGAPSSLPQLRNVRFAGADFFALFALPLREGRAFDRDEQARLEPVVVVSRRLAAALSLRAGGALLIEGRRFRVAGVTAGHQPFRPEWDLVATGSPQDDLYLPLSWFEPLLARPDLQAPQTAAARLDFAQLLRSDTIFVSFWVELDSPARREAYAAYLADRFTSRGVPLALRSYAEWQRAFPMPASDVTFFLGLIGLALLGAGFNIARLLLTKGFASREELGIHRALGATRASLFGRSLLEGVMLALPAALAGLLLTQPYVSLYDHTVDRSGIPLQVTGLGFALGVLPPIIVGLLAALYAAWRSSRTPPTMYLGKL
jgi:putative ABC transport system permease protein